MKLPSFPIRPMNSPTPGASRSQNFQQQDAALFPIFLKLSERRCLVVGAGAVAQQKIESLLAAGAEVKVAAPRATKAVRAWSEAGKLRWEARRFEPADLDGVFLAVAATCRREVNHEVFREARLRNVLINSVDDPPHCDFYYGAVVRRGSLQIAISTAGKSPALAQRVRRELEQVFGPEFGTWLTELGRERQRLLEGGLEAGERRRRLHAMAGREGYEDFVRRGSRAPKGKEAP